MKRRIQTLIAMTLALIMISCSLIGCGNNSGNKSIDNSPELPVSGESKILVAYFSWSGNTQQLANMIAAQTGGELFRIVPQTPYTDDDVFDRAKNELDNQVRPELSAHMEADVMAKYDVIFVGFPVWWYDLPMPVWSFLEEYDLSGKTIIPFFSHNGSSSGAGSVATVKRLCPNSTVEDRYLSIRGSSVGGAEAQVTEWLGRLGLKAED